mmetsp:Transcript_18433/g.29916  ORF Transcript_18433/g.29916 Transcript_18433/m.29916 type:complete len:440 (-) Transcript_18433:151-1470(-)
MDVVAADVTVAAITQTVSPVVAAAVAPVVATVVATSSAELKVDANTSVPALPPPAPVAAWDAHLEIPLGPDTAPERVMQRWLSLGLNTENVKTFCNSCEFISLGCLCAVSNGLQFLGLRRNSYPFDWVRSSLDGIMHCLDSQFSDFLTYSTYTQNGQYVVFGGTRWGGSFWHHNLEVPLTKEDMSRRIRRFYGLDNVAASTPRCFVRAVNSTREINAAQRFKRELSCALSGGPRIRLLLIADMQEEERAMTIAGDEDLLVYAIPESVTMHNLNKGADAFRLCTETYAHAMAFALKFWAGEDVRHHVKTFHSAVELSNAMVQFDGGDPGANLFMPRKFYGQQMEVLTNATLPNLLAKSQTQVFVLPQEFQTSLAVQVFGKNLKVHLPDGCSVGDVLYISLVNQVLSGIVSSSAAVEPRTVKVATVEDLSIAIGDIIMATS